MDGEVNNRTARITQGVKQDETDAGDRQTHEMDTQDGRRRWTYWMGVLDGRTRWTRRTRRRRQHKEGKGLRRVRGKDEGTS